MLNPASAMNKARVLFMSSCLLYEFDSICPLNGLLGFRNFRRVAGCVHSRDAALHEAARQAVQPEPAGAFTRAIEARNYVARKIDHLTLAVDTKPCTRVMDNRYGPSRIEWR